MFCNVCLRAAVQSECVRGEMGLWECYVPSWDSGNYTGLPREGRGRPIIFGPCWRPLERLPRCDCAAGKPHTDAVCEDTLYGAAVEGHQQFLCKLIFPKNSQKVHSLMCLLDGSGGIVLQVRLSSRWTPGIGSWRPSPHSPHDEQGLNVRFLSPAVNNQSLVLVVFRARLFSIHHTTNCSTSSGMQNSSPPEMSPTTWWLVSPANLMMVLLEWVGCSHGCRWLYRRGLSTQPWGSRCWG